MFSILLVSYIRNYAHILVFVLVFYINKFDLHLMKITFLVMERVIDFFVVDRLCLSSVK